jgi:DNA-binding transcriptional LysR family regulator
MKLRSLEAFCSAVEEGSISGAARRMYLSHPTVSERLAELEREVQMPLLERSRQGIMPTPQGTVLYERA